MYLRKSKKKNGRIYLTIVQGYRDENGKNKAKTVKSLGYVDALKAKFDDPIAHFEEECRRLTAEEEAKNAPISIDFYPEQKIDMRAENQVELGAAIPSAYFHRDLGIWSFFERKRTARKFNYDPCRILELLVWNRISHPSSKKQAWEARTRFPRKCDFTLDDVYRCLSYLNQNASELVKHMDSSLEAKRGKRDKTRLYYDVTNYYFEVENEDIGKDGLRKRGVGKEHRPSPIVQMGLLLDGQGIPLDYELFPGNNNDMTTMMPVMKKAGLRKLKTPNGKDHQRVVIVADKGLNTSNNIAACTLDGNGFIFSQSVRKATKALKSWVLDETDYTSESANFKIKSRISDKTITITGDDGKKTRVKVPIKEIAFWSKDFFDRSRYERARVIEKSRAAIENGEMSSACAKTSVRYTKDMPVVKSTGEAASHNWVLDEKKIAQDEEMDGYYCIITSEQEMKDRDIIDAYRGLWRIEESFRVLKSDFDARPVYVSREDHIRAHFLVCFISLLIMRLMQLDSEKQYSSAQIAKDLSNIVGHHMDANVYLFDYRTIITDKLANAIQIDLDKRILKRGEIRDIMAKVRK